MLDIGCNTYSMEAKIFGGASMNITTESDDMMIGKRNILTAEEILAEYKVPLVAKDVGGNHGRRIMMRSDSGKVLLKATQSSK
jgi:chemotaxis protein CheD